MCRHSDPPFSTKISARVSFCADMQGAEGPPAKKTRSAEKQARPASARRGTSAEPAEGKRSKRQRILSNMQP